MERTAIGCMQRDRITFAPTPLVQAQRVLLLPLCSPSRLWPRRSIASVQPKFGGQRCSSIGASLSSDKILKEVDVKIGENGSNENNEWDWRKQWYPVGFIRDLEVGKLHQVRIFDVPYVVVRRSDNKGPIAMEDRCPHRAAALSQGRLTPEGYVQCAYHGWTFNGEAGQCTNIPNVGGGALSGRTCATSIPAAEFQGMVWVYPLPGATPSLHDIAGLPMMDQPGWVSMDFVRDFGVDYTLLLENLLDPDHGPYAHQAQYFNEYIWSTTNQEVDVESNQKGNKYSAKYQLRNKEDPNGPVPTVIFQAPSTIYWYRHSEDWMNKPSLVTAFFLTPLASGKTRFFARYVRNVATQVPIPGWVTGILLNTFVDQDTYLLATQQENVLHEEAMQQLAIQKGHNSSRVLRRRLYCYRSPTDNLIVEVGKWLDEHAMSMPNRYQGIMNISEGGSSADLSSLRPPAREVVLDRFNQHVMLVPQSLKAYHTFKAAQTVFTWGTVVVASCTLSLMLLRAALGPALDEQALDGIIRGLAVGTVVGFLGTKALEGVVSQFVYVYTEDKQQQDLNKLK